MTLEEVQAHNRQLAISKARKKERCSRCELHGGKDYYDLCCPVCQGRGWVWGDSEAPVVTLPTPQPSAAPQARPAPKKPILNKTEARWCAILEGRGYQVMKQAITLRLDPPFTSYRPDLAVLADGKLVFWECKAPHRFAKAGIAKAACAAKTYPCFTFRLAMWTKEGFKESVLSP